MNIRRTTITFAAVAALGAAAAFAQTDAPADRDVKQDAGSANASRGSGGGVSTENQGRRGTSHEANESGSTSAGEVDAGREPDTAKDGKARDPNDALWEMDKDCCP